MTRDVMPTALVTSLIGLLLLAWPMAGPIPIGAQEAGAYLGELTWPEAETHLPMNADAVVMEYLCQQAVDSLRVVVAPPILHGWFPAFREFPGTEVADPDLFADYVLAVASSLVRHGARRIVFLNTGIASATGLPISIAARELRVETGTPTLVVSWDDLETEEIEALQEQPVGGHGDEIETSIHLVLQPHLVRMDLAVPDLRGAGESRSPGYRPGLFSRNPADPAYSTTGHFGDPTLATVEKGEAALAILTRQWLAALRGFSTAPLVQREP